MNVDPDDLREHYASLCDEALMAIKRADLGEIGEACYDAELGRRGVAPEPVELAAPETVVESAPSRPTAIQKAALIAFVTNLLAVAIPIWTMWSLTHHLLTAEKTNPQWWLMPMAVLSILFAAISLLFYFALSRNRAVLSFSRALRLQALAASLALSGLALIELFGWLGSFSSASVLSSTRRPWSINDTAMLFGIFSSCGNILLLFTFFRQAHDAPNRGSISKPFRIAANAAVIASGVVVAMQSAQLLLVPYSYSQLQIIAAQSRVTLPQSLLRVLMVSARPLLAQVCMFAIPYLVWRASSARGADVLQDRELQQED